MLIRISATVLTLVLVLAGNAFADVQLPGIISDHMLLQRDVPVRIFGKAEPGEAVSVTFRGQTARRSPIRSGAGKLWLQPLAVGPAAEMTIRGANTITIADVLVGDVWIGSGQSNMQWAVRQSDNADAEIAQRRSRRSASSTSRGKHRRARRRRGRAVGGLLAGVGRGSSRRSCTFSAGRCTRISRSRWD